MMDNEKKEQQVEEEVKEQDPEEKQSKTPENPVADTKKQDAKAGKKEKDKKIDETEKLKAEIAELTDQLLRTAAEFDNYRKRTDREKASSINYGIGNAIEKLLPVLDTLERAAAADSTDEEYKKGVELTLESFMSALQALGVEEIPALGQPFDPEVHCAVLREENSEAENGAITSVMQKGYRMGEHIIRYAMVVVAS